MRVELLRKNSENLLMKRKYRKCEIVQNPLILNLLSLILRSENLLRSFKYQWCYNYPGGFFFNDYCRTLMDMMVLSKLSIW